MAETKARRQIKRAAKAKGYTVLAMDWSPLGAMVEMQGPEGGWVVQLEAPDGQVEYIPAPNVAWVLDEIGALPALVAAERAAEDS